MNTLSTICQVNHSDRDLESDKICLRLLM